MNRSVFLMDNVTQYHDFISSFCTFLIMARNERTIPNVWALLKLYLKWLLKSELSQTQS